MAALDILKEIYRVCEKNNVPYQLEYGSLLSFVWDGGQIPRDCDIDIIVPYEQKENLIAALKIFMRLQLPTLLTSISAVTEELPIYIKIGRHAILHARTGDSAC